MDDEGDAWRARRLAKLQALATSGDASTEGEAPIDAFIQGNPLVLVDVWAEWCPPCRVMSPVVAELAQEWRGRVAVAKVDADAFPDFAARFGVQGIPTFLFFQNGNLAARLVGARPKRDFEDVLRQLLAKKR